MSNKQNDTLFDKYYQEYIGKGLTPSEAERVAKQKLKLVGKIDLLVTASLDNLLDHKSINFLKADKKDDLVEQAKRTRKYMINEILEIMKKK